MGGGSSLLLRSSRRGSNLVLLCAKGEEENLNNSKIGAAKRVNNPLQEMQLEMKNLPMPSILFQH